MPVRQRSLTQSHLPCMGSEWDCAGIRNVPQQIRKGRDETFVELTFSYQRKNIKFVEIQNIRPKKKRGTGFTTKKADAELFYPDERQPVTKMGQ